MFNFSAVRPIKIVSSEVLQHLLQKNTIFVDVKQLLVVILVMLVLGAVVPGCSDATRYDSRLTTADSLMHDNPDSALAIIEAVNRDSLTTEHDRAYRDLLLTQARYRKRTAFANDSIINYALSYYRAHPAEREKLTRAYIYKGAVMEELGQPDSAMLYYKTAEKVAGSNDYFNLGYSNLRIAQLYQSFYVNDSAVVERMKRASRYFTAIGDTGFLITALGTQGGYPNIVGQDSACFYLNQAIDFARKIDSPKGLQYQSKLAGIYFYHGDYQRAKDLAMGIVKNHPEECNENQFYFYAINSFICLGDIDSARWLMSLVPKPETSVDSMNYFRSLDNISLADKRYQYTQLYSEIASNTKINILNGSRDSKLVETELTWDAHQTKAESDSNWKKIILCLILAIILLLIAGILIVWKRIYDYRSLLSEAQTELEKLLNDIDENRLEWENERNLYRQEIEAKSNELKEAKEKRLDLEREQLKKYRQISNTIRLRHKALDELYENIKIKTITENGGKSVKSVLRLFKELYEQKGIIQKPLPMSFWDTLKLSVDGEFQGIATFVEQKYPDLSINDMHLFLLACANIPNLFIKICMNYTSDVTASKNKKRLMSNKIKLNVTIDEFVQMYLRGELK